MGKEDLLDLPVDRGSLERMVKQEHMDPQDLLVLLVKEENKEQQVHLDFRVCLVLQELLERVENLEMQGQEVKMDFQDFQDQRVKMASQVNEAQQDLQVPQELEAALVLLDLKVEKALLVHLVLLVVWDPQGCKECQEREGVLEILDPREKRETLEAEEEMEHLVKMDYEGL